MLLYFNPVTKEIWGEGEDNESDSHMDTDEDRPREETRGRYIPTPQLPPMDFGDDEINAADRLTRMVSPFLPLTLLECCR